MDPPKKKFKKTNKPCFVMYTDEEIQQKQDANKNKNTTKAEERANNAFQKFLQQTGKANLEYWNYDEEELDNMLCKFYYKARKDPDSDYDSAEDDKQRSNLMYSANTMKNFRYSINRILKTKGHLYDIMNKQTLSFKKSQQAFINSQKELKQLGKAEIHSAPEISEDGKFFVFI